MPTTAQIGASGVLLIQYRLLKAGIESAPMTTDAGIDLVIYAPQAREAITMQVKTCLRPKPAGGRGALALDWWLPLGSPAQTVGVANLEADRAWLFTRQEFEVRAQQQNDKSFHLYFYPDPAYQANPGCHERDFEAFLIERKMSEIFGAPPAARG
jgi:hypothetical protein